MRWFCIRKAKISPDKRITFERFGVSVIGAVLAGGFSPAAPQLLPVYNDPTTKEHAADWMVEQYDRAERWETWSLTMEAAITIFVAWELSLSLHILHPFS